MRQKIEKNIMRGNTTDFITSSSQKLLSIESNVELREDEDNI